MPAGTNRALMANREEGQVSAVPMKGRCEELGISSLFVLCLLVLVTVMDVGSLGTNVPQQQ